MLKSRCRPAEQGELHSVLPEDHALVFKKRSLARSCFAGEGDHSPGVDDALPGDVKPRGKIMESVSCKASLACKAGKSGDCPVRADTAVRNTPGGIPNTDVGAVNHLVVVLAFLTRGAFLAA